MSRILAAFAVVVSLLAAGPAAASSHTAPPARTAPHAAVARSGEQDPRRVHRARHRAIKAYRRARADARRLGRRLHRSHIHGMHGVRHLEAATRRWRHRDAHLRRLLHRRGRAIDAARGAVGVPYLYGGASPGGFDCSGLVMWSYRHAGVRLPHSSTQQMRRGRRVGRRAIRPGDLVFSYSGGHVGLYAGHGLVIAAPHAGTVVQRQPLRGWPVTEVRRLI